AHRMTDEFDRLCTEFLNYKIKVTDVIGEMVISTGSNPTAVAVTAAIRSDDPERLRGLFLKSLDESLPTVRLIQESMDEDQRFRGGIAPFQIVERKPLVVQEFVARLGHTSNLCERDFNEILRIERPDKCGNALHGAIVKRNHNLRRVGKCRF